LRKRITLTAILGITLAVILTGAAVIAQTPAPQTTNTSRNVVTYVTGGVVNVEVPNGSIQHPLNLRIAVTDVDEKSDYGGPSVMQIYIWVPSMNQYSGVAILSTNTNQTAINWIKDVVNGTPIWNPPAMQNYFVPTENQLKVYMSGDTLWANLTTSYNITLPAQLGGNFTLPPMTLMFVQIGEGFHHQETTVLPKPAYSGWTMQMDRTVVPSWVRVQIPMWVGVAPIETVGSMNLDGTVIYIPPTS
jgi:hypothetical protein